MPKFKNSNATFWVIFKQCECGVFYSLTRNLFFLISVGGKKFNQNWEQKKKKGSSRAWKGGRRKRKFIAFFFAYKSSETTTFVIINVAWWIFIYEELKRWISWWTLTFWVEPWKMWKNLLYLGKNESRLPSGGISFNHFFG